MPHRDPRTGQFVADAEDVHSTGYEDYDVQRVGLHVDFSETAGATFLFDDFHLTEPLGGLGRDELAELVALTTRVTIIPAGAETGAADIRARAEVSLDGASQMLDFSDAALEPDVDGATGVDRRLWELESDPDILDSWSLGGAEETNNTAGVGLFEGQYVDRTVYMRPLYGRGPVLDRHDDVHFHFWKQTTGDNSTDIFWETALVWDVFDR